MKMCSGCCELIAELAGRCKYCGEPQPALVLEREALEKAVLGLNQLLKTGNKQAAARQAHQLRQRIARAANAEEFGEQRAQIEQLIDQLGIPPRLQKTDPYLLWLKVLAALLVFQLLVPWLPREEVLPRWEYRIESVSDYSFDSELEQLGSGGWELVFARRATGSDREALYEMIFKRPLRKSE